MSAVRRDSDHASVPSGRGGTGRRIARAAPAPPRSHSVTINDSVAAIVARAEEIRAENADAPNELPVAREGPVGAGPGGDAGSEVPTDAAGRNTPRST